MRQKFCINCGERVFEGAKFCAFCGAKLITPEIIQKEPEVTEEPEQVVIEEPDLFEPPVIELPQEPVPEEPEPVIIEEPVIEEPAAEEPEPVVIEEPVVEEPAAEEPEAPQVFERPAAWELPAEPEPEMIEEPDAEEPEMIELPPEPEEPEEEPDDDIDPFREAFFDLYDNKSEGTLILVDQSHARPGDKLEKNGVLYLDSREMERGVVKILDFGTGDRFEVTVPAGVREGDRLLIQGTGIKDHTTGADCEIILRIVSQP